jgi:hypothetical protein
MSHDRSDAIRLPADKARCEPSNPCSMRTKCARYQASLPKHGGSMEDYTIPLPVNAGGGTANCRGYINVHTLHAPLPEKPAPVVRPNPGVW